MAFLQMDGGGGRAPARRKTPVRNLSRATPPKAPVRRNLSRATPPKAPIRRDLSRATPPKTQVRDLSTVSRSSSTGGGGGGSYSGGGFTGGGGAIQQASATVAPTPPPEPPKPKTWDELSKKEQEDYLKGDATFVAQQASLEQELKNLIAELTAQRTNYMTDYNSALTNMGWNADQESFDPNNLLGAYGQAFQNQQEDFAGRGMLDSSAYARSLENLGTSFDRQRGDLENALSNFERELGTRQQGAERTNVQDLQRARADAIARRAAQVGLV